MAHGKTGVEVIAGLVAAVGVCANDETVTNAVARTTANDNEAVLRVVMARSYSERLTTVKLMRTRRTDYVREELTRRANKMMLI
jgi:DNA-binding TFAR19-related protein (PDSD5 family)